MTPSLGLLLTTCLLLAAPAKDEDPARRAQATLQRVSKLPPEHQRVWLRLVEQRYAWAVLLTLKPEDAKREQARVAKVLRQGTVGWNELIDLLRQLDQREKAAIARLVRQYRLDVYETFRKRPRDLVDRQEAWYRIWSLWEKAGSPPDQQDRLMDWLAAAIKVSSQDSVGPLPADPKFGDDVPLVSEQLVKQLTQPSAARPPASTPGKSQPAAPRQPADDFLLGADLPSDWLLPLRVPDPRRAINLVKQAPTAVVLRRAENFPSLPLPDVAPPAIVPPLHVLPSIAADDPRELTRPSALPHQALVLAVRGLESKPLGFVGPEQPSPAEQAEQHAQVNVDELCTRIEGINLSLRNLEAELNEKRDFTADELDALLSRLDILVLRQKDLALFRNLITAREQAKVGQIDSSGSLVAAMGTHIANLRAHLREIDSLPDDERTAVLKHLDELSDRLATMTAEK